jgi:hypothetical protein
MKIASVRPTIHPLILWFILTACGAKPNLKLGMALLDAILSGKAVEGIAGFH